MTMPSKTDMPAALEHKLRAAGLRPTRQRLALAEILFSSGDCHVSAEELHSQAVQAKAGVSLATVYNTLNQFKSAGLLREVAIEGDRSYFDTNTSNHFHFYDEQSGHLQDISAEGLDVIGLPQLPEGTEVAGLDVIIRLRQSASGR